MNMADVFGSSKSQPWQVRHEKVSDRCMLILEHDPRTTCVGLDYILGKAAAFGYRYNTLGQL